MSGLRRSVGHCFITRVLLEQMQEEADARAPAETGGVLLGVADHLSVWVDVVVGPGPNAAHERSYFVPDAEYHEEQVAAAYERSGRRIAYLGDWHTHPGASAFLSPKDRKTLRAIGRYAAARQPNPIMAVLGGGNPWKLAVWRLAGRTWYSPRRTPEVMTVKVR